MDYKELEQICENYNICIWGFGRYGKSFVYISLKCVHSNILFYCDKNAVNPNSFQGIPLVREETLYQIANNMQNNKKILVFVAIRDLSAQSEIIGKLKEKGISSRIFDLMTLTELCTSIKRSGKKEIINKYKELINDELYLKFVFRQRMGKELNLKNPKTFNEKIAWRKIHDRNPLLTKLVDKAEAKNYVSEIIGSKHIIPTLGTWDCFEEIGTSDLPNSFVIKCTHDSGSVVLCKDKNTFNWNEAKRKINNALQSNYFYFHREWAYENAKPRIIVEKYLTDESQEELKDYKFFCFNGIVKFIQVDFGRFVNHKRNLYDVNWRFIDKKIIYPNDKSFFVDRPKQLNEMIEMTSILSKDLPFVRIDWYSVENDFYFGEFTFYPEAGYAMFDPISFDYEVGEYMDLPK